MSLEVESINFDALNLGRPSVINLYENKFIVPVDLLMAATGNNSTTCRQSVSSMAKEGVPGVQFHAVRGLKRGGHDSNFLTFHNAINLLRHQSRKRAIPKLKEMIEILEKSPIYAQEEALQVVVLSLSYSSNGSLNRLIRPSRPLPSRSHNLFSPSYPLFSTLFPTLVALLPLLQRRATTSGIRRTLVMNLVMIL